MAVGMTLLILTAGIDLTVGTISHIRCCLWCGGSQGNRRNALGNAQSERVWGIQLAYRLRNLPCTLGAAVGYLQGKTEHKISHTTLHRNAWRNDSLARRYAGDWRRFAHHQF